MTTGLTRAGSVIGTPGYMAPEQVVASVVGPTTDVYATGLVLAEMLTGRPVYAAGTSMQILVAQASPAPVPLPAEVVSSPLWAIIDRATQKDPSRRFSSAAEMLAAIDGEPPAIGAGALSASVRPAFAWQPSQVPLPFATDGQLGAVPFVATSSIEPRRTGMPGWVFALGGGVAALALVAVIVLFASGTQAAATAPAAASTPAPNNSAAPPAAPQGAATPTTSPTLPPTNKPAPTTTRPRKPPKGSSF
jgi:serine/threonine-protein kinase